MRRGRVTQGWLRDRDVWGIALFCYLLAFGIRFFWVLYIQSPFDAVYSDMGGYVWRATNLLRGTHPLDGRNEAFYPWGTHFLVAAEFWLVGEKSRAGIGLIQSLVGALVSPSAVFITARLVQGRRMGKLAALVAGVWLAFWHPQITYSAYFMSEVWFFGFLTVTCWLCARHAEGRGGAILGGLTLALAYVVRPQVLLTLLIIAAAIKVFRLRGSITLRSAREWAPYLAPFFVLAIVSSVRLYQLSGRVGFVSENDKLNRVFADTDIGRLESHWMLPNGTVGSAWYSPAGKHPLPPNSFVYFDGYIGDPVALEKVRRDRLKGVSFADLMVRRISNLQFLVYKTFPNPETDYMKIPWRGRLQKVFRLTTLRMLPIAALGVVVMLKRRRFMDVVVVANLVTIAFAAAFFFAEARHRVSYDGFLVIATIVGAHAILRFLSWLVVRFRGVPRSTGSKETETSWTTTPATPSEATLAKPHLATAAAQAAPAARPARVHPRASAKPRSK